MNNYDKLKKIYDNNIIYNNEFINYADDMILCFQYKEEAKKTYNLLKTRLKQLGLEFAEDKTRLIEFGRFASENRKKSGENKPDTFDFLGFTHYCSKVIKPEDLELKGKLLKRSSSRKYKGSKFG